MIFYACMGSIDEQVRRAVEISVCPAAYYVSYSELSTARS